MLSGDGLARETELAVTDGGGVTYTAATARGGAVKVTSYLEAAGAQGATLRAAHGRMVARAEAGHGPMPLAWDASHQGHGVSWCHVELTQPPVGVTSEGLPERLLWDDAPALGFVLKGKHLAIPSSGASSSWQRGYTDSAAAVRYWWLRERLGVPAARIDASSVRSAHTRSGQRIEVRIEDTVRYAWLAAEAASEVEGVPVFPAAPSGNEFPPSRPAELADDAAWWSKSPVEPTDASPTVWRAESVRDIEGVWSDWGDVTRYQGLGEEPLRDVRPASDPAPAMPEAPADGSDYVVTLDRYAEGLPAGFNPGDADDPVRAALEADAASSRYGVSGAISAADDVERVEEELDFAWAGSVVELGGRLSFRPGADVASSGTITAVNGEALSVAPPPPRSERINGASLSLPASRIHGGAGYSLPELMDETAVALDGAALVEDLGEAAYLSSPTAARRVLRTMLRASRAARGRRYRVQAGSSGSWLSVRPGRQVTVTDSTQGLADAGFLVVGTVLAPDTGTLELDLLEQSAGTFVDEIELPVAYSAMVRAVLAAPMDLEAQDVTWIGRDGTARSRIKVTWTQETGASTQVKWLPVLLADQTLETVVDGMPETIKMADASDSESLVSTGGSAYLAPVRQGVLYLISARHVLGGVESPWSLTFVAALGDEQTPASPSGLRGMPIPGGVRLEWSLAAEKDYAHTEVYDGSSGTVVVRETRPIGRIRGTYFEHRIESLGAMPAARSYLVRHVDRSGNVSAEGSVSATPLPLRSGGELLRDEAYLAQAAGAEAPTGVDLSGEWTRKPVAPTDSLPVVWRSYREAELGGEVNLVWSQWTAPQPYAVFEDRAVDGFTRNVELEFRSSDPEGVLIAESDVFIEPTPNAPLVEVRQRFRASFADSFPDWDPLVQRWTTVGKYTHDGVRCGVLAALDRSYGCDPNEQRSIYRRTASATAPGNPGGTHAIPADWSPGKLSASAEERYVYRLTVNATNCEWPDWTVAGTPELFDEWTEAAYWTLVDGGDAPETPEGEAPEGWLDTQPEFNTAPQCRWTSTRSGSPCAGYTWSAPERDGAEEGARSIYTRTNSSAAPPNPGGTLPAPADWSADELCATDAERYAYSLTVTTTHCMWPDWSTAGDPVSTDEWTDTPYWTLESAGDAPATPSGETPPADWSDMRPEFNDAPQCRWTSTRSGSPCAGYAWSTPERDGANEETRSIYRRTNSSTAPANPGGTLSAPADWSTDELCATDAERYAYSLTVTTTHCVWPDWSTAGDPVSTDEWTDTPYWTLESGGDVPATPSGETPPVDWTDMRPEFDDAPQCRWKSTRSGSPCAGYAWSAPERDGANEATRSIYRRTNSSTAPANPGGTLPAPADWSADELCATAAERYVHSLTVTTANCIWPAWSTAAAEVSDEWTVTEYRRLTDTETAPAAPTVDEPADWTTERPAITDSMPYRWKSTREGSECAGYTWTAPVIDPDSRSVYKLTNSATPPANPTGAAEVPDGWSEEKLCATSDNRYVYCLTVTPVNGVWPDWSTAGTPVLFDHWTAIPYYWLAAGCESAPAPSLAWPTAPPDFTTAPQCRWTSTRSGSPCADYAWSTTEIHACNEASRTIYKRTNSATPPANPGGTEAVPAGWSSSELCATSDDRYVYSLTVTTVHCVWPDWSTAGTPVLFDRWTVRRYYWLAQGCESAPAPSITWPTVPPDFTTAPQCRWKSTRSGSPCAGYTWSTTQIHACNEASRTIYKRTNSATPPANPGGTEAVPDGWSGEKPSATSDDRYVYSLTVTTVHCVWPDWSTAGDPVLTDEWTDTPYWTLESDGDAPATPSGETPPADWFDMRPEFDDAPQCRWKSTRSGSPCADYTWSAPERDGANEATRSIYRRTNSATPPTNPGGKEAVPDGWSGEKPSATSDDRYVYSLTVTTVHCAWPDWSTAGTPVLTDHWTVRMYYWLAQGCESAPAPSITWPTVPPDFTTAPQCRWKSTRSGSPCAGYTWSTTQIHACNEASRTIYKRTDSATPPTNPGGKEAVPDGWSGEKPSATSDDRYVYSLTVTTVHCAWPDWSTAGTPVLTDHWTVRMYWRLEAENVTPTTPQGAQPTGWVRPLPPPTGSKPCRWKSTRTGSPCARYTWTAPALLPPLTPTGFRVVECTDTTVKVEWTGSRCATGYQVRWYATGSPALVQTATTTGTGYTVGSLTQLTEYQFQVLARNSGGDSDNAQLSARTKRRVEPPGPPTNVTVSKSEYALTFSWSPPLDNGGSPVTAYVTELKVSTDVTWGRTVDDHSATTRSRTFTGLKAGVQYDFHVAAVNEAGQGPWTAISEPATCPGWTAWKKSSLPSAIVGDVSGTAEESSGFVGRWNADSQGIWSGGGDSGWMAVIEGLGAWRDSLVQFFKTTGGHVSIQLRNVDTDQWEYLDSSVTVQTGAVYVTGALNNFSSLYVVFDGVHITAIGNRPDGASRVGYVSWIPATPSTGRPGSQYWMGNNPSNTIRLAFSRSYYPV